MILDPDRYDQYDAAQLDKYRTEIEALLRQTGTAYVQLESKFFGKDLGYSDWIDVFICNIDAITFDDETDEPKGVKVSNVTSVNNILQEYRRDYGDGFEGAKNLIENGRRSDREGWIPFGKATIARHDGPADFRIFTEDGITRGRAMDADIVIQRTIPTRWGDKLALESPFEAKEDIKSLEWDDFHPDWNGSVWTTDNEPEALADELTDAGWSVAVKANLMDV